MTPRAPSVRRLVAALGITPAVARQVRGVIHGRIDPCDVSPAAHKRAMLAFHPHAAHVLKLEALNELLGMYGVEHVPAGRSVRRSPRFDYLNTGETYATTILRFSGGRYRIGSWGDQVERGNYA